MRGDACAASGRYSSAPAYVASSDGGVSRRLGTTPSTLVRAGHIRAHDPGAPALADVLFRAERPPYCLHWF